MSYDASTANEWLEADGLGGFASGTTAGIRTRRYHGLLLVATRPPADRYLLVNGLETWIRTDAGTFPLTSQRYAPDVVHPDGFRRIVSFHAEPWPTWTLELGDGARVRHELWMQHGRARTVLSWSIDSRPGSKAELVARPLLSGRDPHVLHHENPTFRFEPVATGERAVAWRPYAGLPGVVALANGAYEHAPDWYRGFLYEQERARGLDHVEDLASPGLFRWSLAGGATAYLVLEAGDPEQTGRGDAVRTARASRAAERRRRARFATAVDRAADSYLVRRGSGLTVVAGYPWFGDWGRDTFIAVRGLCLATGRTEDAGRILDQWADLVSEGMMPNRLPDYGEQPEYNSVDASLWYAIAVHDYLEAATAEAKPASRQRARTLQEAVDSILEGYARGTRHGIRRDDDGLLAAGEPGVQLTWMDAKVGDWVVTPRVGKPVEVQALWLNALRVAGSWNPRWRGAFERGVESFVERFWYAEGGFLYDVVDVDHTAGKTDPTLRPNQILAVGGLPFAVLDGDRARRVVDTVEQSLLVPLGLRSLAPGSPGYVPRYRGGVRERDGGYHQGTVWPWLLGPFVEAWVRVRGNRPAVRREAARRFLPALEEHLGHAGLGHVSEIVDAEPPHAPKGCPFQAWSLGEMLRLSRRVLAPRRQTTRDRSQGRRSTSAPRPSRRERLSRSSVPSSSTT